MIFFETKVWPLMEYTRDEALRPAVGASRSTPTSKYGVGSQLVLQGDVDI
jgi:hypothetical protein